MIAKITLELVERGDVEGGSLIYIPVSECHFPGVFDQELPILLKKMSGNGWHIFNRSGSSISDFVEFFLDVLGNDEDDYTWDEQTTVEDRLGDMWHKEEEFIDIETDGSYLKIHQIAIHGEGSFPEINLPNKVSDSIVLCIIGSMEFEIDAKQVYIIA